MENKQERLGSRLGFILISAGCAIGVGNVWKFPTYAGMYGGGIFVLIYLICLLVMGIPILTMEFSLGRASQKSPVLLYQQIEPKGSKWHIHGYVSYIGNIILMMFYTTVSGWMLAYFVKSVLGEFEGADPEVVQSTFGALVSNPGEIVLYMGISVALGFFVCSFKLQKGLERVTKYMMLALLVIMAILAVRSFFMPGTKEGLSFYLKPDASKLTLQSVVMAMNQAFFTLSVGMGSMAIFGSYIGRDRALLGESLRIVGLDTFVAITAGLIIFPACFSFGIEPTAGTSLIFITLPNIFNGMAAGRLWGSLFFLFMTFAAFSTVLGVFENIVACTRDLTGWSRRKTCLIGGIGLFLLSLPCALGFNLLSGFQPLGEGSVVLDLEDFLVSNCILPLGSLVYVIFCTQKFGFGWNNFLNEANTGKGAKFPKWAKFYLTWILPLIILIVFGIGIAETVKKLI